MPTFPQEWMDELRARNDIVSVVSEYVALTQKGGRYWGLCPFHGEKTASFSVNEEKQFYYCFGCHAGGDAIRFVQDMDKLSFIDAVKQLATRAGMELPQQIHDETIQKEREKRNRLLHLNQEAARYFHQVLRGEDGKKAFHYLQKRGLAEATAVAFGLGASPPQGDGLTQHLLEKGCRKEDLLEVGVSREREGRVYDAFRDRLIFPIIAGNRQVVGFGGRALEDRQPKYLNSPESVIFNKRRQLFGLNMIRGRTLPSLLLVEGYMDLISLHQAGITNVVATLGTALTTAQARLMKRYTAKVFLAYDGDSAGQNANLRGLDLLEKEGLEVLVLSFPEGEDPDDFVRREGSEGVRTCMDEALTANAFRLSLMRSRFDLAQAEEREGYAKEASAWIQTLSPVEQERYFAILSEETRFRVETLREEGIRRSGHSAKNDDDGLRPTKAKAEQLPEGVSRRRLQLERAVIANAVGFEGRVQETLPYVSSFMVPAHKRLWQTLASEPSKSAADILVEAEQEDTKLLAAAFAMPDFDNPTRVLRLALIDLRICANDEAIALLQKSAEEENDLDARQRGIMEIQVLQLLNSELQNERDFVSAQ